MEIEFTVPGLPKGKGRHRLGKAGNTYTPTDTVIYENLVRTMYYNECGNKKLEGPLGAIVGIFYSIPKSESKKRRGLMLENKIQVTKKPDIDNVLKSVFDSLNKIAYDDDSQIVSVEAAKYYSDNPRVEVKLFENQSERE